jgi:hypothetical protein|tara:strand:- start:4538 stop:4927 length:390 start_codon:yes stop_codon:yes gene_type:complete
MAYAAAVTTEIKTISGRRHYLISVTETEARDTSEFEITGLPKAATLVLYRATLTAGSGNRINPAGGNAAAFAIHGQNQEFLITGATHVNESTHVPLRLINNKLVIRNTPNNTATDHSISTLITIVEGVI